MNTAIRGILRYAWMGPLHWLATLTSFLVVPLIVPLASEDGWLPKWLAWFQTGDNTLDGDDGWQTRHRPWLSTPYEQLSVFQRYISRVLWLYRNPVYGLEKHVLCATITPDTIFEYYGNRGVGDFASTPPYQQGCYFITAQSNNRCYAQFGGFFKLNGEKSVDWLIGWKLGYIPTPLEAETTAQICTTLRSTRMIK